MNEKKRHRNRIKTEKKVYLITISVYLCVFLSSLSTLAIVVGRSLNENKMAIQEMTPEPSYITTEPTDLKVYKVVREDAEKSEKTEEAPVIVNKKEETIDDAAKEEPVMNASKMSSLERALEELMKLTEGE